MMNRRERRVEISLQLRILAQDSAKAGLETP
jgi:hypothetical protein